MMSECNSNSSPPQEMSQVWTFIYSSGRSEEHRGWSWIIPKRLLGWSQGLPNWKVQISPLPVPSFCNLSISACKVGSHLERESELQDLGKFFGAVKPRAFLVGSPPIVIKKGEWAAQTEALTDQGAFAIHSLPLFYLPLMVQILPEMPECRPLYGATWFGSPRFCSSFIPIKGGTEKGTITLGRRKGKGQWLRALGWGLYHFSVVEVSEMSVFWLCGCLLDVCP